MRSLLRIAVVLAACVTTGSAIAAEWGVVRYARSATNIRSGRGTESAVVGRLLAGESVRADFLKDNWFAVFAVNTTERDESTALGYVYAPLLDPAPPSEDAGGGNRAGEVIPFEIVAREDVSYVGTSRMVFRVVATVSAVPTDEQLRGLARHVWEAGNRKWHEFTVFLYLPDMDTNSLAYCVGECSPKGLRRFSVNKFALAGTKWAQ